MKQKLTAVMLFFLVIVSFFSLDAYAGESSNNSNISSESLNYTSYPDKCSICPKIYSPVCGSDGKDYDNYCLAKCAGVSYKEGKCLEVREEVKEEVECLFEDSEGLQKCYSADYNNKYSCSGDKGCIINVKGIKGEKITWKSSCGGYAYTIIDGEKEYAKFDCKGISETGGTIPPFEESILSNIWYKKAYVKCYDGSETKLGGESSCKTSDTWMKYAEEFCKDKCFGVKCKESVGSAVNNSKCTGVNKCGVKEFKVSNQCNQDIIAKPVCGNNVCEDGEGEICEVETYCKIEDAENKKCKEIKKCSYGCKKDCGRGEDIIVNFDEKFKLQMSQTAVVGRKGDSINIKFNDLWIPKCASSSEKCVGGLPTAVLQIKYSDSNDVNEKVQAYTEVIKLVLNEEKIIKKWKISFIDYDASEKIGVFVISKVIGDEVFKCPADCVCDSEGKIIECVKPVECTEGLKLCPDGKCSESCEIIDISPDVDVPSKCDYGCMYGEKCFPYGFRVNKMFCSVDGSLQQQLKSDNMCENNFECSSNVCVSGKCISEGLLEKIINWFSNFFGKK